MKEDKDNVVGGLDEVMALRLEALTNARVN
jgi:hypothetical protein